MRSTATISTSRTSLSSIAMIGKAAKNCLAKEDPLKITTTTTFRKAIDCTNHKYDLSTTAPKATRAGSRPKTQVTSIASSIAVSNTSQVNAETRNP